MEALSGLVLIFGCISDGMGLDRLRALYIIGLMCLGLKIGQTRIDCLDIDTSTYTPSRRERQNQPPSRTQNFLSYPIPTLTPPSTKQQQLNPK